MGGRGASVKKTTGIKSRFNNTTKKDRDSKPSDDHKIPGKNLAERLTNFIEHQTNININKYRDETTRKFDTRGKYISVNWNAMDRNTQNAIMNLSHQYKGRYFTYEDGGEWMMVLRFKEGLNKGRKNK